MANKGLLAQTADELKGLLFDLEVHWRWPCSNCQWKGDDRAHPARAFAMEQLIVGGWFDPARRWPVEVPAFMRHLVGEAFPDGKR